MRPALVEVLRVQAVLLARQQQWEEVEAALEETLTLCQAISTPYAEAKTLYVFGQVSLQQGAPEQARERSRSAQLILSQLGERLYAKRIEQLLSEQKRH